MSLEVGVTAPALPLASCMALPAWSISPDLRIPTLSSGPETVRTTSGPFVSVCPGGEKGAPFLGQTPSPGPRDPATSNCQSLEVATPAVGSFLLVTLRPTCLPQTPWRKWGQSVRLEDRGKQPPERGVTFPRQQRVRHDGKGGESHLPRTVSWVPLLKTYHGD